MAVEEETASSVGRLPRCRLGAASGTARFAAILVLVAVGVSARQAGASTRQPALVGEHVQSMDVKVDIDEDGSIRVAETIVYDFGGLERHGIDRYVPVRFAVDRRPEGYDVDVERVTPLTDLSVSSPDGSPTDVEVERGGGVESLRIGDPERTISGVHTWVISYRLGGVLNGFEDHDELYLDVNGDGWGVPFGEVRARVSAPGSVNRVACFGGAAGSAVPCPTATKADRDAEFRAGPLQPHQTMTIVVGMPKGVVDEPVPIFDEVWSVGRAFSVAALPLASAGVVGMAGAGIAGVALARRSRDRRFVGGATDAAFGSATEEITPFGQTIPSPVEFVPPNDIRPAMLGTLIDERADEVDVSAMLVDLAVRGYVQIEERPVAALLRDSIDYTFRLRKAVDDQLTAPERVLLNRLFASGDTVELSALKGSFGDDLAAVQSSLYDEVVRSGWFRRRPDVDRQRRVMLGVAVVVVGIVATVALAAVSRFGLVGLGVVIVGLAIVVTARTAPARTAAGSAMAARSRGFREIFEAGEGERQEFYEQQGLFTRYLPYAIVFGCAQQWVDRFAALGLSAADMGMGTWYVSPYGYNAHAFGTAVTHMSTTSVGTMAEAAHAAASGGSGFSSGGGFSGGGFGGGGGGSW